MKKGLLCNEADDSDYFEWICASCKAHNEMTKCRADTIITCSGCKKDFKAQFRSVVADLIEA